MKKIISEVGARIYAFDGKICRKLPVFYNPAMEMNRTISVLLLRALGRKDMQIGLPLAGSGIRGIRFLKELDAGQIRKIYFNDHIKNFEKIVDENLRLNKLGKNKVAVENKDANAFLEESLGFDYIDIDPFGTPNPFLESAIKRLSRDGILAVTATDTGCLAGSFQNACERKYFAKPLKNELMHETGLRILIRKVQLVGMQHEKALVPIFSYSLLHYMRVFFLCDKGKQKCDELLKTHKYLLYCAKCMKFFTSEYNYAECCGRRMEYAGPLFSGELADEELCGRMEKECSDEKTRKFINTIKREVKTQFFYDVHKMGRLYKIEILKMNELLEALKKEGFVAERTHFDEYAIKTNAKLEKVIEIIQLFA